MPKLADEFFLGLKISHVFIMKAILHNVNKKFILNIIVQLLTNLRLSAKIISTRGVVYSAHEAHIGPFH